MKVKTLTLTIAIIFVGLIANKAIADSMPFSLPSLPYEYNSLEPVIDAKTMEVHHTKHHQAFVDRLNLEAETNADLKTKTIEEILANISKYNNGIRNSAGGFWNHSFFWQIMNSPNNKTKPSAELSKAIEVKFGSLDNFKTAFEKAGADRFGSGWVWLIVNDKKELEIVSSANQDNPLMQDFANKGTPILGNDVWEHAYYLKYQNRRTEYMKNWWQVVNWNKVSENFANAIK
jgi:Fe-Mn family superoxide dismutase